MRYKTAIFDFDSTLVSVESLEIILTSLIDKDPEKLNTITKLTEQAMNGEINFKDALIQRLNIAAPTQQSIANFITNYCPNSLSIGMAKFIQILQENDVNIFIISGGFKEVILPFSKFLHLPEQNVYAVEIHWDNQGNFIELNNSNGFADSKIKGAEKIQSKFSNDSVIIGDGFTDYELYKTKIVSDFIAYTGNIKREKIMKCAPHTAESVNDLLKLFALPQLSG